MINSNIKLGLLLFFIFFFSCNIDQSESHLESAKLNIKKEQYEEAIEKLELITEERAFYTDAQKLRIKVDSLKIMQTEKLRKQKEEEDLNKAFEALLKQKNQLENEIKAINQGIKFDSYRGTIENLQLEIVLFGTWTKIIIEGEKSEDKKVKKLAKKLKSKVIGIQIKEFPKLRKEYTSIVANKMWENNITVKPSGTGHNKINFTGGLFASNKNIKEFQTTLEEILTMFRFVQSRYKWYSGQDEYTYYSMEPPKDKELVYFE